MFHKFLESAPDAMLIVDEQGRILLVNTNTERLFGYSRQELIGQSIEQLMPDRYRQLHLGHRARYSGEPRVRAMGSGLDLFGLRRDGTEFPLEISLSPLPTKEGLLVSSAIRDVTERQRTQQALARAKEVAEAASRELESFSYSVAHDLRAPLRSIAGFSQAVIEDYGPQLEAEGQSHLQRIRAAANRLAGLIDDLLALSRVSRSELRREPVDLTRLVQEILTRLRSASGERAVEIQVAEAMVVRGDARLLAIALENLLNNALKFSRNRQLARIEVGVMPTSVSPQTLFVRDNGAGFDMAHSERLFGAFQRLHRVTEFEGSGIGLATVQRIIHRHGGRIWAEAAVDRGATFYFTLLPVLP